MDCSKALETIPVELLQIIAVVNTPDTGAWQALIALPVFGRWTLTSEGRKWRRKLVKIIADRYGITHTVAGRAHSFDDHPSRIMRGGTFQWHYCGRLHRAGGRPSIIHRDIRYYHLHGKKHRVGGPAYESGDGTVMYYTDGILDRPGGEPAVTRPGIIACWYKSGYLHNMAGGPAIVHSSGKEHWFINGVEQITCQ